LKYLKIDSSQSLKKFNPTINDSRESKTEPKTTHILKAFKMFLVSSDFFVWHPFKERMSSPKFVKKDPSCQQWLPDINNAWWLSVLNSTGSYNSQSKTRWYKIFEYGVMNVITIYIQMGIIYSDYKLCARWVLLVTPDSSSCLLGCSVRVLPPPLLLINCLSCSPLGGPGPPPFPPPGLTPFFSGSRHLPASTSATVNNIQE
jgi:hypothetical protein